jgi:small subunit ribosomal protein S21
MSKKQKQHQTIVPGNSLAVNVVGTQREDLGFALKVWKRKVKNSGILERIKDRKEFEKPSVRKRKQLQAAQFIQRIKDLNSF